MKKILSIVILFATVLPACKKDYHKYVAEFNTDFSNSAFLKVIDLTVGAKRNLVYSDGIPLTGAALTSGSAFPATTTYALVAPGSRTITIKDTSLTTVQKPISATGNFTAGGYYTIFTNDTLTNANYVLAQDNISVPTDGTARLRFANMIFSSGVVPNVDVFSSQQQKVLFSDVATGQVEDFIAIPSNTSDTLYVRASGTTTNLAFNVFSAGPQRSYTLAFAGAYGTTGSTSPTAILFTTR